MSKKVFISYSHKDEHHRETLEEHLSLLQRNGHISVWHDRKITPGEEWAGSIDSNLEAADIIIFLVSSSFLASSYCQDIEVSRALKKYENKEATVISIIVRPCHWHDSGLSKLQAVPKDAKAITEWENEDAAWVDAISGLKQHISDFKSQKSIQPKALSNDKIAPTPFILEWTNDTEIKLTHRKVNKITLSDIYVAPDMELESDNDDDPIKIKSTSELAKSPSHKIIFGEEQQGKTSLLKHLFIELLKESYIPIYLDANNIKTSKIDENLRPEIERQYQNLDYETFLSAKNTAVLIDNIDDISLNAKFRNIFIKNLSESFGFILFTCHTSFSYVANDIPAFDNYMTCELLGLGNIKREEIVQKWISLGEEENIDEFELYSNCDELKSRLDTVIKRNIVPPKPIYVLMLLQMFEANSGLNLELTSYGHCYQQLIYQSFDKAKINKLDFDKYLNVLTELSWLIFTNDSDPNDSELKSFFERYCEEFLPVDQREVTKKLTDHSILCQKRATIGFKYPYIYYFFVAKKIAESYADNQKTREAVETLLESLHREDYANILIFITHHTKDSWVLNKINNVLESLFEKNQKATLDKNQLSFMNDFIKQIPELIIEQREIQKERDEHNRKLDEIERKSQDEITEADDILANINKTFKGMEIAGQIIRNRHSSLKRNVIYDLAKSGTSTGLRFLEYFIKISESSKKEVVKIIANYLTDKPDLSDKEIERHAEHAYLHLTYGVINGVIKKIGASIGSREALEIYSALETDTKTPAYNLIRQAIELQFNKTLKTESIESTAEKLKDNPVCKRILKEMVIQHTYMFPVDYKTKQQLSERLGISVQGQRLMDQRKRGKG
ncbi:TIR domain-containing protein [Microbulbifer harenosus]|uniref:Toll/interleukin-1 receptor domain-containing protein n=1 Tax=Microbulbifer harenosus TaxID=2576840 RepID=A0ABY2UFD3_9GAMM|nr:toll/interleukin-1 receptor domain-containing protein [Microbulbifer harenosus]TLM76084.1 toll/interleukin-1 receptor domain-containing protein [Microbulbifer harenosus]